MMAAFLFIMELDKHMAPNNIRRLRENANMSLRNLSTATGINVGDLSLIERNRRELFPSWSKRISAALCVNESELL
jgi:transcriptional regulator with XRE-family HTH domain